MKKRNKIDNEERRVEEGGFLRFLCLHIISSCLLVLIEKLSLSLFRYLTIVYESLCTQ